MLGGVFRTALIEEPDKALGCLIKQCILHVFLSILSFTAGNTFTALP